MPTIFEDRRSGLKNKKDEEREESVRGGHNPKARSSVRASEREIDR